MAVATNNDVLSLIDAQYQSVEALANAQSRLLNASLQRSSSSAADLVAAIENLESCREEVRSIWRQLLADEDFCKRHKEHVDLSARVMKTVAMNPSWDSMGIQSHNNGILESNTVALASLRASLARVKDI